MVHTFSIQAFCHGQVLSGVTIHSAKCLYQPTGPFFYDGLSLVLQTHCRYHDLGVGLSFQPGPPLDRAFETLASPWGQPETLGAAHAGVRRPGEAVGPKRDV